MHLLDPWVWKQVHLWMWNYSRVCYDHINMINIHDEKRLLRETKADIKGKRLITSPGWVDVCGYNVFFLQKVFKWHTCLKYENIQYGFRYHSLVPILLLVQSMSIKTMQLNIWCYEKRQTVSSCNFYVIEEDIVLAFKCILFYNPYHSMVGVIWLCYF